MNRRARAQRADLQLEAAELFVAWYAPEHHTPRLAAPFFERRFASMKWSILTPDESHPSAILRMEEGLAAQAYSELVVDPKLAHQLATR